ncbi:MAG: flagellar biosynthetic protein FliO [Desulfobacteraceae bacterium]|jgi:flagellar biogenesis protein FliO
MTKHGPSTKTIEPAIDIFVHHGDGGVIVEQPELMSMLLRLLFAFIGLVGILVVARFTLKRSGRLGAMVGSRSLVQVVSTGYIGVKKSVTIVKIPDAILVLGVTNERITLLSKIEDQALIDRICANNPIEESPSFYRQLHKLTTGLARSNNKQKSN